MLNANKKILLALNLSFEVLILLIRFVMARTNIYEQKKVCAQRNFRIIRPAFVHCKYVTYHIMFKMIP